MMYILLLMGNIPNICINMDGNMVDPWKTFSLYLLNNINIDVKIVHPQRTFIHLMGVGSRIQNIVVLNEGGSFP